MVSVSILTWHLPTVFTHCLSCKVRFSESGLLTRTVRGEWIAYDPVRGRLWSICRTCRSWSLAAIEERWETVEELERITTQDRGATRPRLLSRTDQIALFERGRLRIVRVGESSRAEEAWWRYGHHLREQWRQEQRITVGGAATLGAAIVGGLLTTALPARYAFRNVGEVRRWLRFGDRAWSGHKKCPLCGYAFSELSFFDRTIVNLCLQTDPAMGPGLLRRCPGCGDATEGGLHLTGVEAQQTLARLLAYDHHPGVSERQIRAAINLIDREGEASDLVRVLIRHTGQFGDLPPPAATAIEIATNEAREELLLRLEVAALERYWSEAEELASIVDGELTDVSGLERLRLRAVTEL